MALVLYFTLKNAVVPGKGGHAEKREKAALFCWHRSSEKGPTEGSGAGGGCLYLCAPPLPGVAGEGAGMPGQSMAGKSSFHQLFKQEASGYGSALFAHTSSPTVIYQHKFSCSPGEEIGWMSTTKVLQSAAQCPNGDHLVSLEGLCWD